MINDIKVEDSFVKTGYSNWKNARSNVKGFTSTKLQNVASKLSRT